MENVKLKSKVKAYWEKHTPGLWNSSADKRSKRFFEEADKVREEHYSYISKLISSLKPRAKEVLEIGCGLGKDLMEFAKNGAIVTGTDLTENAVSMTKRRFNLFNMKAEVYVDDAEKLLHTKKKFDIVYSNGVLHHTPDIQKSIDNVYRVLKPNGKAVIMLYAKGFHYYYCLILKKWLLELNFLKMSKQQCVNKYTEFKGNSPLTKYYTIKEIHKIFRKFSSIKIRKYELGAKLERLIPLFLVPFVERKLGHHHIIIAEK